MDPIVKKMISKSKIYSIHGNENPRSKSKSSRKNKTTTKRKSSRKLFPTLKRGELKKFGYSTSKVTKERREALARAVKKYTPLSVFRKLNVVQILTKNRSPKSSAKFGKDKEWIKRNFLKKNN